MSEQVASQTSSFPDDHGASDMPSGLLPSVLSRPVGSNREQMPAVANDGIQGSMAMMTPSTSLAT